MVSSYINLNYTQAIKPVTIRSVALHGNEIKSYFNDELLGDKRAPSIVFILGHL